MYYDLIYTRCRHGVDILRSGQPILSDGFKVYACCSDLYKEDIVDLQLVMNSLQKKQSFSEPDFMDDAYLYAVPDAGFSFLNSFHPIPYDLSVTGDFAKRPGMYLNHAIIGNFKYLYPFEIFHDRKVWTARENNEAYYYENEPADLECREIRASESPFYSFSKIGNFIKDGRADALKKAVAFILGQFLLPLDKRKYLVIKDESSENIEMWIGAIELAFSPRIASNIPFATRMDKFINSNIYYVKEDGSFSQQQQSSPANHTRLRAMIVGVVSKDKSNQVRILNDSPYVVLDGENKKAEFNMESLGEFFNIISSFDGMHERFSREFLQSFDIHFPSADFNALAKAYEILCGDSFGSPEEYAKALSVLSKYKIYKTNIISEIYEKVNCRLGQFIKSSLEKSFPILNWVGDVSDVVGDPDAKTRLSEIIRDRAKEVFFTDYKKGGITAFWDEVKGGPFVEDVGKFLTDMSDADEYAEVIRLYDSSDAVLFLEIYCMLCRDILRKGESAKLIVSYCVTSCEKKPMTDSSYKRILLTLKKVVGDDALKFLLDGIKTYEPEIFDSVVDHVIVVSSGRGLTLDDMFLLCGDLSEYGMYDKEQMLVRHYIEDAENIMELEAFSERAVSAACFDEKTKEKIYELLDGRVNVEEQDSEIFAASIQKNLPKDTVCTNSAHIVAIDNLLHMKKGDSVKMCLKPYIKQDFPSVLSKNYVARLISALLKIKTTREDQWFILDLLLESPDIFLKQYMSALVMTAESNPEKWERTLEFIYASPNARTKRKLESILSSSIVNSGLKKKNLDALGKLLSDKSMRKYYENIIDDAADEIKERDGSIVSKLFGGFRK